MLKIFDSNRPGFAGVLVDVQKKTVIADLKKVGDGWGLAMDYKRKNGIRCGTERIAKVFSGFEDIGIDATGAVVTEERASVVSKYNVATRFEFMETLIDMVVHGAVASCIVTGPAGVGKTYTVMQALHKAGFAEGEYVVVRGKTTPFGLYQMLHDNRHATIVFDDCDSAFEHGDSENLLKAVLDSTDRRVVSWNSSKLPDGYDSPFEFKGRIIFVSNLPLNRFDNAIVSRSMIIDLQMTREEIIDRIDKIADKVIPLEKQSRAEVIDFLRENKDSMNDLNIRTYIKVAKIRVHGGERWRDMATFMACS